jgi:DNA topoisomerase VI subunit B
MTRLGIAFRLFFRALKNRQFADEGARLLAGASLSAPAAPKAPEPRPEPLRSDALTLLAVLQREARLVDFLKENISAFDDAQVGAAVRDVHRDAGAALDRLFSLQPVMREPEESSVVVPAGADAARVRLTGNVTGKPPFRGTLRHQGWEAAKTQLPEWSGSSASANVVAPAEVELA